MQYFIELYGSAVMAFFGGISIAQASNLTMNSQECSFPSEACLKCSSILVCEAEKQGALIAQ